MGRSNGRGLAASGVARKLTASEKVRLTRSLLVDLADVSFHRMKVLSPRDLNIPMRGPRAHDHLGRLNPAISLTLLPPQRDVAS